MPFHPNSMILNINIKLYKNSKENHELSANSANKCIFVTALRISTPSVCSRPSQGHEVQIQATKSSSSGYDSLNRHKLSAKLCHYYCPRVGLSY